MLESVYMFLDLCKCTRETDKHVHLVFGDNLTLVYRFSLSPMHYKDKGGNSVALSFLY